VSPTVPIKLMSLNTSHPIISHSCLPIFSCYSHPSCTSPALNSMATEYASNPPPTNPSIDDDVGSDSRVKNTMMMTSSFLTRNTSLMAKGEIHELTDFFKGTTVSE
jgi:hypothetical protein